MTTTRDTAAPRDCGTDPVSGDSTVVAFAWPTGRPIYPYTLEELAVGVDLYTRAMKARTGAATGPGGDDAARR